jgi:hypothetical protein
VCSELITVQQGRKAFDSGATVYESDFWAMVGKQPLVVLDELGCREKVTDFQYETVKAVLDARDGRPLVVASNLGPEGLAVVYDDRIASRLMAGSVLELQGEDRRLSR